MQPLLTILNDVPPASIRGRLLFRDGVYIVVVRVMISITTLKTAAQKKAQSCHKGNPGLGTGMYLTVKQERLQLA